MRKILPFCAFALLLHVKASAQAVTPYTTCPNVNIAIMRAGTNFDFNSPNYLYDVNTTTGAMTQVPGGPFKDPSNGRNLQVNGIGVNNKDGFIYGLNANPASTTSTQFLRLDKNYGVTVLGSIPAPQGAPTPGFSGGFVNTAAGDFDGRGNYYFTAGVVNSSLQITNLYIGKIANVQALTPGSGFAVTYSEINYTNGCLDYVNSLQSDPNNSGIKDISYNAANNEFLTYATYKRPGAANFSGQLVKITPIPGSNPLRYEMTCSPQVNTHSTESSGMLIDQSGNFLVSMTDGTVGTIGGTPVEYTGQYTTLNSNTGLPNPLRGDMATCNSPSNAPLPVRLSSFNVSSKDCNNSFNWITENETDFNHYELEQSTDNISFRTVSNVPARRNSTSTSYKITLPAGAKQQYYRLKIVDDNGRITYSNILNVTNTCNSQFGFVINPNPVLRQLNLNWYGVAANAHIDIAIFSANGAVVSKLSKVLPEGISTLNLDVSNLPKGSYWIKAFDVTNNNSFQKNFVKQ